MPPNRPAPTGYAEVFSGIADDVVEKVSHGNAESLFRWKMADEEPADVARRRVVARGAR